MLVFKKERRTSGYTSADRFQSPGATTHPVKHHSAKDQVFHKGQGLLGPVAVKGEEVEQLHVAAELLEDGEGVREVGGVVGRGPQDAATEDLAEGKEADQRRAGESR